MPKLTPCPKCTSTDVWSNSLSAGMRSECDGCGFQGPIRATADQAQTAWLAQAEIDRHTEQLRQQNRDLLARITRLQDFIRESPMGSGVCCCGNDMADHPLDDHSPVDEWDHAVRCILEETNIEHLSVP